MFPSHRFPTDKSFHLLSSLSYGSEAAAYDEESSRETLDSSLTRIRLTINPEYQPSRQFLIGAYLNVDSLKLSGSGQNAAKSGLSDQYLFGEFRAVDEVGYSYGFGTVFKIPLYSTPKDVSGAEPFLLLGDGQIDATFVFSAEYWPWEYFKFTGDLGATYRSDEHASELPFQLGGEYVSRKFNIGLNLLGNLSFNNDKATQTVSSQEIQTLTGGTHYVFAKNPQSFLLQIKGEYAFTHQWAAVASFTNTLWGKNAPYFSNLTAGVVYRFFEPAVRQRSAREVGIGTDDSSQDFEGELQEKVEDESLQEGGPLEEE